MYKNLDTTAQFSHEILKTVANRVCNLKQPWIKNFDGSQDPRGHIQELVTKLRLVGYSEALMCLGFPLTLKDYAYTWFYMLPSGSIMGWSQLCNLFVRTFLGLLEFSKPIGKLMKIKEKLDESLQQYLQRWNKAVVNTKAEGGVAVPAFINSLKNTWIAYDMSRLELNTIDALVKEVTRHTKAKSAMGAVNASLP